MSTDQGLVNVTPRLTVTADIKSFLSFSMMHIIETTLQVSVVPILVVCGVFMNVINMAVFLRQGLSDRINLCLFSLALCDAGYLLFLMASRFFSVLYLFSDTLGDYWKFKGFLLVGPYVGFLNTSNCLTLLISLERCICVMWPLKAKTLVSTRAMMYVIVLAFAFCFSCGLIFCFKFDAEGYLDPTTNVTRYRPVLTHMYRRHHVVADSIYENVNIFLPTTSLTVVMAATVLIAVRMRSVLEWRQSAASMGNPSLAKERPEASVTRMLVVVCTIYTLCTLPYVTHAFFRYTVPDFQPHGRYQNLMHVTITMMHSILCINCSANFLVYFTMSTRFKDTLNELIQRCKREKSASTVTK